MAVGVLLMPAPGPGTLILIVGALITAQESLRVARLMDWAETRLRRAARWAVQWWKKSSLSGKLLLAAMIVLLATSAGLAGFKLLADLVSSRA